MIHNHLLDQSEPRNYRKYIPLCWLLQKNLNENDTKNIYSSMNSIINSFDQFIIDVVLVFLLLTLSPFNIYPITHQLLSPGTQRTCCVCR